jgi:hypothetical protein
MTNLDRIVESVALIVIWALCIWAAVEAINIFKDIFKDDHKPKKGGQI